MTNNDPHEIIFNSWAYKHYQKNIKDNKKFLEYVETEILKYPGEKLNNIIDAIVLVYVFGIKNKGMMPWIF